MSEITEREVSIFHQSGQPHKGAKMFVCPRCSCRSMQYPALSRADNKTKICSACGTDEALFCMVHTKKRVFGAKYFLDARSRYRYETCAEKNRG